MTTLLSASKSIRSALNAYQPVLKSWAAFLGDGTGTVIGSQANYFYCRYPAAESPAVEVYANGCPPNDGMRVMVGYSADQPKLIKIVSWTDSALDDRTNDHVKNHGDQHGYLGGDTVWVDWRQITTFRVEPYSGLTVYVRGGVLPRSGADLQVVPQIIDLTSSVPGSAGQARYALISLDSTGAIVVTNGSVVTPIMSLDAADVPDTPAGNFRLAAVALQYGQTNITESLLQRDILDLRWPQESMAGLGVITPSMLANASAQYKYLVSGATPFAYAESAGALNIASGKTLTASNSLTLAGTDGLTLTISGNSTINGILDKDNYTSVLQVYTLGDSLTAGYNGSYDSAGYTRQLKASLGSVWAISNLGVDGYNTTGVATEASNAIAANDAQYAVILAGVNDALQSRSAATIETNLQAIYTALHNAGIKVVACTILPFKGAAGWSSGIQAVATSVNAWILATATDVDYKVDTFTALQGAADTLDAAYDAGDHLHLNATGYDLLGTTIYNGATWARVRGYQVNIGNTSVSLDQSLTTYSRPTFNRLYVGNNVINDRGFGYGGEAVYPLHAQGNVNGTFASPVITNSNTGTAAVVSSIWGEDTSTKKLELIVFGTNYSSPSLALSAVFTAQSGLSGGLGFQTNTTAPITFSTNGANKQMSIDGSTGAVSTTISFSTPLATIDHAVITGLLADRIQLIVQGHSTQTTNLQEWQDSTATPVAKLTGTGQVIASNKSKAAPSFAFLGNSATGFYWRSGVVEFSLNNSAIVQYSSNGIVNGGANGYVLSNGQVDGVSPDVGIKRATTNALTVSNGSSGFGNLLIGTTTDGMTAGGSFKVAKDFVALASQTGAYTATAVDLTLTVAHHWVTVTAAKTITLPAASGCTGREYIITATANSVVVDGNASETINGSLTVSLNAGDTLQIKSEGANWFII